MTATAVSATQTAARAAKAGQSARLCQPASQQQSGRQRVNSSIYLARQRASQPAAVAQQASQQQRAASQRASQPAAAARQQPASQSASRPAASRPASDQQHQQRASSEPAASSRASQLVNSVVLRGVALLYESSGGNQVDGLPPVPTF